MKDRISDKNRLEHILDSISEIRKFVNGIGFEE